MLLRKIYKRIKRLVYRMFGPFIQEFPSAGLFKSLWFNFRYLPFKDAINLPFVLSRYVKIEYCYKGFCEFVDGGGKSGIRIGLGDRNVNYDKPSILNIRGKLIIKGRGFHLFSQGLELVIKQGAVMEVGDEFGVSDSARITVAKSLIIGDYNMWSYDNVIMDTDSHSIEDMDGNLLNPNQGVKFGNHVWLGCRNIVLKGTEIADGVVIASGSVINKSITEPNCIATSNGKILNRNINWNRQCPNYSV